MRATQFHEFAGTIVDSLTDGEDVRVPDALIQPIAGDEVAAFTTWLRWRHPATTW